jgi:hypothetical protein
MESFEHLCKVALEAEGFAVTSNAKFPVRRRTKRVGHEEYQTHGYEIDLVGARGGQLVLAEVKSYLGSVGVNRQGFVGLADRSRKTFFDRYKLINNPDLQLEVAKVACARFGYMPEQLEWRIYVGNFAKGQDVEIRNYLLTLSPPVHVIGLHDIVGSLIELAKQKTYFDDPVLMTVKALMAADRISGEQADNAVLEGEEED